MLHDDWRNAPVVDTFVVDGRIIPVYCLRDYAEAKRDYWDSLQPKNRKVKRLLVEKEKPNVAVA
jgi:hypothetical protein